MRDILKKTLAPALAAGLALSLLAGCGGNTGNIETTATPAVNAPTETVANTAAPDAATGIDTEVPVSVDVDESGATAITLSGASAAVSGSGARADGGVVTVTDGGTYILSGTLTEGRVIVDAKGEDVVLVLNGASITCSYGSPVYVYKAASATIHLPDGTSSSLSDGTSYTFADEYSGAEEDEPNACLYSKADLIIQGGGRLTVTGNYNNGITSKDTLSVVDATLVVSASNNGITGKDSADFSGASLTVTSGGDGIRSTNADDAALGWVRLTGCEVEISSGEDGVQAETLLSVDGGNYNVTSGAGSSSRPSDSASSKGLKGGTGVTLLDGEFTLNCSDDAVHSNGDVTVSGGTYTVSTYDDAFHADETLTVSGGNIDIPTCYEGLEGSDVVISGGVIYLTSSDDGVNAGGGTDSSGFGGWGGFPGGNFGGGGDYSVTISGGYLCITAGGDGLDSNGTMEMTGGTVIVSCSTNDNGALDYDSGFTISGGELLAFGGGMPEAPSGATQGTVYAAFGTTLPAGTAVCLSSGSDALVFELPVSSNYFVCSSPEIETGESWTVSYGGSYSGSFTDNLGSGGSYSGGTELTTLSITDGVTSYGSAGWGMGGGMPGGGRGGNMGGMPGGRGGF